MMIPTYEEAILNIQPTLAELGLSLSLKNDYKIVFSHGPRAVVFEVERYYHPGLLASITDIYGKPRELGLVIATIDPPLREQMLADFNALDAEYNFNKRTLAQIIDDGSLAHHLNLGFEYFRAFFLRHGAIAFDMPPDLQAEYTRLGNEALASFGLKPNTS